MISLLTSSSICGTEKNTTAINLTTKNGTNWSAAVQNGRDLLPPAVDAHYFDLEYEL
jgi:hypothetical protein